MRDDIMPKCPKCGNEIDRLIVHRCMLGEVYNDDTNDIRYEWDNQREGWPADEWKFLCPECGRVLFRDFEDAKEFLQSDGQ